ncbi:twin-arginine translocase subunit TatC [Pseudofulvibacter geojedonensis]|uniref:Sec-independent protein translocase protein TatC n=1 Tax=Pseudofulvibacter geojedonensis TaxID=1123758 RepID=A0ABW3HYR1_9FLAO
MAKKDPNEMSFLDHLEILRRHLIRAVLAVLIVAAIMFSLPGFVYDTLIFGPTDPGFMTYKGLCNLSKAIGMDEGLCIESFNFKIQSRTLAGQFSSHIWVSITLGFIVAFPYVIYELWKFVSPGLHQNERKNSRGFIVVSSLLFFLGVLFGYFIICPLSINFLANYFVSKSVENNFDLDSIVGIVRACSLASGLLFELPIIIYFLTKIGLVTPEFLKKNRKVALVLILIVSAIITPPDLASQIVVAIPVMILYEISIIISKRIVKKEQKKTLS